MEPRLLDERAGCACLLPAVPCSAVPCSAITPDASSAAARGSRLKPSARIRAACCRPRTAHWPARPAPRPSPSPWTAAPAACAPTPTAAASTVHVVSDGIHHAGRAAETMLLQRTSSFNTVSVCSLSRSCASFCKRISSFSASSDRICGCNAAAVPVVSAGATARRRGGLQRGHTQDPAACVCPCLHARQAWMCCTCSHWQG